jgi:cytochrome c biogenesis protein CcdA/thiol-disulfide isomerase/thioredoxin
MVLSSTIFSFVFLISSSIPTVHFFYVTDCGHCMDILLEHLPQLQTQYKFTLKKYDIDILDNYLLLEEMEAHADSVGEDLPVVFLEDSVFYGPEETRAKLGPTLAQYGQETFLPAQPARAHKPRNPVDTALVDTMKGTIKDTHLYYFFQPGCDGCDRIEVVLQHIQKNHKAILIHRYDILEDTSKMLFEAISETLHLPHDNRLIVPAVIIEDHILQKEAITFAELDSLISLYPHGTARYDSLDIMSAEKSILERFSKFSILGIIVAGLIDGINPCAFATLIFFVTYLLFIGRRRHDVIVMSVFFILAVFISYYAIGLGAYGLIRYFTHYEIIGRIIFLCFGVIALLLGVLSFRDFFLAHQGKTNQMILQLPLGIKQRIHKGIKEKTAVGGIIIGSLIAGFVISYLEFGCTGQVYLPTITFMVSKAGLSLKPLLSLLVYNLMFILPLIVISICASLFTTKNIAKTLEKRIPTIKLITALLFFGLGVLLILSA